MFMKFDMLNTKIINSAHEKLKNVDNLYKLICYLFIHPFVLFRVL